MTKRVMAGAMLTTTAARIARALGVAKTEVESLRSGRERLTGEQSRALEELTGKSVGQLALANVVAEGNPKKVKRDAAIIATTDRLLAGLKGLGHAHAKPQRRARAV